MHDLETVFSEISRKAHKGFVRFHAAETRKTTIVAKILQRFALLQECISYEAPEGEVFAYGSAETFACQVQLYKFIHLCRSPLAKFLTVSVFQPETFTRHDKWQVSFDPYCRVIASYKLSELVWTCRDEDED